MKVSELRLERLRRGLSLDEIYIRSGQKLHPSRLSRIERSLIQPTEEELRLLGEALDIPHEQIAAFGSLVTIG